jgi:ankyrin repeat protein
VSAKTNFGLTPLISAAAGGHMPVVQVLLDSGADLKARDNNTWTALVWASNEGHKDVVELLKQARDRQSR